MQPQQPAEFQDPYARVVEAVEALVSRLADELPAVEGVWVRQTTKGVAPRTYEDSREFSLIIDVGDIVSVLVRQYDVNREGFAPDHQLLYTRAHASDAGGSDDPVSGDCG
jgi:hypothetical protein